MELNRAGERKGRRVATGAVRSLQPQGVVSDPAHWRGRLWQVWWSQTFSKELGDKIRRKRAQEPSQVEIRSGRQLTSYHHRQNRFSIRLTACISNKLTAQSSEETKSKLQPPYLLPQPLLPPAPELCRGTGSVPSAVCLTLLHGHSFALLFSLGRITNIKSL